MEENTIKKLKKLVKVSEELTISQMAEFLGIDEKSLNEHIVDWADEFGFTLNQDVVKFGSGRKDALESLRRDLKQVVKEEKEFVIYDADKARGIYVQFCLHSPNLYMECVGNMNLSLENKLSNDKIEILEKLGFKLDSQVGNYGLEFKGASDEEIDKAIDLTFSILHDIFGI